MRQQPLACLLELLVLLSVDDVYRHNKSKVSKTEAEGREGEVRLCAFGGKRLDSSQLVGHKNSACER